MAKWKAMDERVRLVRITYGADFEIDVSKFDAGAAFAYVDDYTFRVADYRGGVEILHGFTIDGQITISDRPPFMWLAGPRNCILLRPTVRDRASFRSLTVGEFCVEIYCVHPDGRAELVHQNDFTFK